MDTNTKDLQRVVFSTSGSGDDLPFIDDAIFEEPMTVEESVAEYKLLKERERKNLEEVPVGAKKANKHYLPWEEMMSDFKIQVSGVQEVPKDQEEMGPFPQDYKGILYSDILRKYWELFNDGKESMKGDRDTLTYQLACDLRHICDRNANWLDQVIPCYDGFPLEEKRKKILSALQAKS